ncbi:hypothetical protein DFJ74DRAFT_773069 [Hyaloraphidium curvatum]|nr:hypothetical protein DFJ74DRAFT_773069 [Hyaloraphidium curvatum]
MPPRRKSQRIAALDTDDSGAYVPVAPISGSLTGIPVEVQHQIFELVLADGGLGAAFALARTCRDLLVAFRGLPLWRRVAERHKFKQRSKKLPLDERLVVEKLQKKEQHLCHNLACLGLTKLQYFVPTGPGREGRFCPACLAGLWAFNPWIRKQSGASKEWKDAKALTNSGSRLNKGRVLELGLKDAVVRTIPHTVEYRRTSGGYLGGTVEYREHLYKPTDVLLKQYRLYGGQGGVDARKAQEARDLRKKAAALVPEMLAAASGKLGIDIGWTGNHPVLEAMDSSSNPKKAAEKAVLDLAHEAAARALVPAALHFPGVAFVPERPPALDALEAWYAKQTARKAAHEELDGAAAAQVARLQARAADLGIEFDVLGRVLPSLRVGYLWDDQKLEEQMMLLRIEKDAGIPADAGTGLTDNERLARAEKQIAARRTSPPDPDFSPLRDDELPHLPPLHRAAIDAEIRRTAQELADREAASRDPAALPGLEVPADAPGKLGIGAAVLAGLWRGALARALRGRFEDARAAWEAAEGRGEFGPGECASAVPALAPFAELVREYPVAPPKPADGDRSYYCSKCGYYSRQLTTYKELELRHGCGEEWIKKK